MLRDLISGLFWLCMGLLLSVWSLVEYQTGTLGQPGPGFLPLALGGLVTLFSLVLIASAIKAKKAKGPGKLLEKGWGKAAVTVLVMLVAALFFEKIGYLITFFFLSLLLMIVGGLKGWKKILLIAVLTTAGIYVCFVLLLKQPLPYGPLGI